MWRANYIIPYTRWCCCLSSRNGTLIVAILGLLLSIVITLFSIIGLVFGAIDNDEGNKSNFSSMEARIGLITSLVFGLINIVLYVMLFMGIFRHQHKFMVPWLVMFLLFIIISLPVAIFSTIGNFNITLSPIRMSTESLSRTLASENRHVNFYPVLFWFILTPVEIYLWIVVNSLYRDIQDENHLILAIKKDSVIFQESRNHNSSPFQGSRRLKTQEMILPDEEEFDEYPHNLSSEPIDI